MIKHKKHVDVITKFFWPVAAGIETNILETYAPQSKNWNTIIHTSRDTHIEKDILPNGEILRGLKIKRYHRGLGFYWPKISWQRTDIVALHNFDVFPHAPYLVYTLFLKLTGRKKFRLFVTPHGGFNPEWSIFIWPVRIPKWLYHYTIGTLLINAAADGVRAVSEWEKIEMIKKGLHAHKIEVISNGIEDDAYHNIEKDASVNIKKTVNSFGSYILNIGRVYPIKNYETVIKALPLIDSKIKYVIAGPISDVKYKGRLDNLIRELNLTDRVIFAGIIRGVDKYYLIRHAEMMVHMAIWESFCNVVHEGLSQGLPIVAANNTALPLLVKDGVNGFCVPTYDTSAVAEKINYILMHKNSLEIKKMKETNKKIGLEERWTNVSKKMKTFYEK